MPGLSGRFSTVVKAKVSKMLDRAEDPQETLDYSYEKQLELLQNVKKGIADVVTSKKRLQMQTASSSSRSSSSTRRPARRSAPARRTSRAPRSSASSSPRPSCSRSTSRSPSSRPAAEADRERAEAARQDRGVPDQEGGHQGAVLRRRGPGPDLRGRDRRGRADGRRRPRDAARARQDRADARPRDAVEELEAAGTFDDITQLGSGEDDIDRQLKALTSSSQVDDDLAKMRAELGSGEAPKPAGELGQGGQAQ
jgi:phage shock protein A